jgi:hypothetical protein
MADTPSSLGRRYLPFIAIAAVQVLLVAVAPSKGPQAVRAGDVASGAVNGNTLSNGAAAGDSGAASGSGGSSVGGSSTGTGGSGGGSLTATGGTGGTGGTSGAVDRSHCDKNGRQIGPPKYTMPPCVPVWHGGDNGGATMTGVDATHINYVWYKAKGDAQVNAILATQGLAASNDDACLGYQAYDKEINKRWELYGRKFVSMDGPSANKGSTAQNNCHFPYFNGQCTLTPPDPVCERAEAKVIAAMKPAFVLAGVADPALYDELAKDHIIVVGGGGAPESYYDQGAPYFYGLLMDGTRQAKFDAEYWCKKLNGKPVGHAGADVTTGRGWGSPPTSPPVRKIGVIYPENNGDQTITLSVNYFKQLLSGGVCNSPGGVFTVKYASDINTAQQQAANIIQQLIQNKVTTVACWCDPIAPVFLTTNMTSQGYFPEHFVLGVGLIDYDQLGRLYDSQQWQHAFGVSDLALPQTFSDGDSTHWWQDSGNAGQPGDKTSNAVVPFFSIMATAFQMAGPKPTPELIHQGLMALPIAGGWAATHDQTIIKVGFRPPSPWTAAEDTREVNWNAGRTSEVDGKPGSYCPVNGGQRYDLNEWGTGNPQVFDQAHNGC